MQNTDQASLQNMLRNNIIDTSLDIESLASWIKAYFQFEVTTLKSSQKVQERDLNLFLTFYRMETGSDLIGNWTPRLSQSFKINLQEAILKDGKRRWSDRTINRILSHLKTFAKWVHKHKPFYLGNPTEKLKNNSTTSLLEVERALTKTDRRKLLDAADLLIQVGGLSKDRHRYRKPEDKPKRKNYRPYRNRAIIYTLIETGMRRSGIVNINLDGVDFIKGSVSTVEKGGGTHTYQISKDGISAIEDYIQEERGQDIVDPASHFLFIPVNTVMKEIWKSKMSPKTVNDIWNQVCKFAGVEGKTPHSARHAMGKHITEKTGNVEAVQRQLGHKNATYSLQYSRITGAELHNVLNDRG